MINSPPPQPDELPPVIDRFFTHDVPAGVNRSARWFGAARSVTRFPPSMVLSEDTRPSPVIWISTGAVPQLNVTVACPEASDVANPAPVQLAAVPVPTIEVLAGGVVKLCRGPMTGAPTVGT